ncbi:MAG: hypothetical protein V4629_11640 [Pseudomonadota bacterium]
MAVDAKELRQKQQSWFGLKLEEMEGIRFVSQKHRRNSNFAG